MLRPIHPLEIVMDTTNRRRFLQLGALTLAAPLAVRFAIPTAQAQALPKLPVDHPQAKALAYIEDAAKTTHPAFKPGSDCANCRLFTASNGACTLFPGYSVPAKAWCAAWVTI
jgi:hypothetical protein